MLPGPYLTCRKSTYGSSSWVDTVEEMEEAQVEGHQQVSTHHLVCRGSEVSWAPAGGPLADAPGYAAG
jgi:hypothetical protein